MARPDARHPDNVDGNWYADTRCIACDVARHYAPGLIAADAEGLSVVVRQPVTPEEEAAMWRAAVACPTRSIGTAVRTPEPRDVFPWPLTGGVHLLGHNDRSSFGAHSYLVQRGGPNLMVDAPRWSPRLASAIEDLGGIDHVLLTHRDDVADADRYARHFDARVWIHAADAAAAPGATDVVEGTEPVDVAPGVRILPARPHTGQRPVPRGRRPVVHRRHAPPPRGRRPPRRVRGGDVVLLGGAGPLDGPAPGPGPLPLGAAGARQVGPGGA